jgi:hypothetical protein
MIGIAARIFLVASVMQVAACSGGGWPSDSSLEAMDRHPALDWLRANRNPSALATNRFGSTENAIAFVKRLTAAGATSVYVAEPLDEPERIEAEGGPYADTLIVELPDRQSDREALLQIIGDEARAQEAEPPQDRGQRFEVLWWD